MALPASRAVLGALFDATLDAIVLVDQSGVITAWNRQAEAVFGWSAALGRGRYTSGAVCQEQSEALVISGAALRRLCEVDPETGVLILERLAEVIAERLQATHAQVLAMLHQGMQPERRS